MLKDIECGKIDCVVTKDLSRLGRNYLMTGYYTDEYFPEQHCRYIEINDGVDTMGANNDFAAFHNVINEYYPRDISKKVRQVKRTNTEKGMFMGSRAPYGYKKSLEDKHKLIIDKDTSWVVKKIFGKFINGENARMIADDLNNMNLLCPRAYRERFEEQLKILFNKLIEKITIYEFSVPGEKEVCLNIVIDLKIPGYAPKYALQFKQDLKNREKEDKKKNTNNHKNESSYLDGGEGEI